MSGPRPIVALDVGSFEDAVALVDRLGAACDFYKVGLELFAADGPDTVEWLRGEGKSVFVDLKAYDIPNTVKGVARSVAALGASLLTVHGAGGAAMVRAAVEGAGVQDGSGCGILVVTVLTSFDAEAYAAASGRAVDLPAEVERLAGIAHEAGAQGVVCSGVEVARVHARFGEGLRTLVPGVRFDDGSKHDQARTITPAAARETAATYIVAGRAVTQSADPAAAYARLAHELGYGA